MKLTTINCDGGIISPNGDTSQWPADATSCFGSPVAVPQPTFSNPGLGDAAPNAGTPLVTTKNPDGSTRTVNGTVAGVTINNPV
jgi:hypothetical protein